MQREEHLLWLHFSNLEATFIFLKYAIYGDTTGTSLINI